jgi:TRAP transporter TAXI family solute receptor
MKKRMSFVKKLLCVGAAVLAAAGATAAVYAADANLILATGGTAGTYYPFGGAMARIWNTKIAGMNVTAQTSGASAENVRLVDKKEVELALVQSDTLDFAYNAKEGFKQPIKSMSTIAVLYPERCQQPVSLFCRERRTVQGPAHRCLYRDGRHSQRRDHGYRHPA